MTQPRPECSIPGCTAPVITLKSGWCSAHYQRAKYHGGDPLAGRTKNGEAVAYFRRHLMTVTAACKTWPYKAIRADDGRGVPTYGQVWIDGRYHSVHVLACEAFNGPMPEPGLDAAHSCGHPLCWNGLHLRWATRKENMADQLLDGTRNQGERNGGARLSEAQVHEIRGLYDDGTPVDELATRYGIAKNHVHQIGKRTRWRYLPERER